MELVERLPSLNAIYAIECSDVQIHGMLGRFQTNNGRQQDAIHLKKVRLDSSRPALEFENFVFSNDTNSDIVSVPPYLMYSLHACGSLSETMVQLFCDPNSRARVLFNMACCYNLIDEGLPGDHFPMSREISECWDAPSSETSSGHLSRNMKMVACQAPARWRDRPELGLAIPDNFDDGIDGGSHQLWLFMSNELAQFGLSRKSPFS